jgi:uncharacterized protein
MDYFKFVWDEDKDEINRKKHDVSFEEAMTAFYDEDGLFIHDPDHSKSEERFILLGMSRRYSLLVVIHCYREDDEVVRIISARKAEKDEEYQYYRRK